MKILHLIANLAPPYGGPTKAAPQSPMAVKYKDLIER